jgi:hypothetical protein
MLGKLSIEIQACYWHAEECACFAAAIKSDPELRQDYLDMEKRWLKLARNYELVERLEAFQPIISPISSKWPG